MPTVRSVRVMSLGWCRCLGLLLGVLVSTGCAPSSKEVAAANFGPAPDRCERLIQQEIDLTVFSGHPGDYIFKEPPYKAAVKRSLLSGAEYGWIVEFEAKGQISMGTGGYRTYHCFFSPDGGMKLLGTDATIRRISGK